MDVYVLGKKGGPAVRKGKEEKKSGKKKKKEETSSEEEEEEEGSDSDSEEDLTPTKSSAKAKNSILHQVEGLAGIPTYIDIG